MTLQDWQSPDELPLLADGISQQTQYRTEFTDALAGSSLRLVDTDGRAQKWNFLDSHTVRREVAGATTQHQYDATAIRDGIFLVDSLVDGPELPASASGLPVSITWTFDFPGGRVKESYSWTCPQGNGELGVRTKHTSLWMADSDGRTEHPRSSGLVGHRILWQYSDTDFYDHIYLNENNFAWQCVAGVEKGLTELDRTRVFEIAPNLFLFNWSEHVQPVESVLLIDLDNLRTYGRMYGWEHRTAETLHHQFGAYGRLLNKTVYPELTPWDFE